MKKGLFVLANLALLSLFCVPAFSQPNNRAVETVVIDDFDSEGEQNYMYDKDTFNWTWKVQASRFVAEGYPVIKSFDGIPNSLRFLPRAKEGTPKVLGVKTKYNRKGDNWFEIYPSKDDKPFEIPFAGTVTQVDFWVWGAHYLYFLDILVRDADGRVHIIPAGNLAFDGWKNVVVKIPTYIRQHSRFRSGPVSMTFVGFRITTDPDEFVDDFLVYFDQFKYTTNTLSNIYDGYELRDSDFGDGDSSSKDGE